MTKTSIDAPQTAGDAPEEPTRGARAKAHIEAREAERRASQARAGPLAGPLVEEKKSQVQKQRQPTCLAQGCILPFAF